MRSCLKHSPPSSNNFSSPISQEYSAADNTPTSSVQRSPTVNLSREYTRAIHTISYNEIQRIFYEEFSFDPSVSIVGQVETIEGPHLLQKVLKPTRECIEEALSSVNHNSLTYLAATYFEHSEHTSRLYFLLYQTLHHARFLYTPLHKLLEDLPIESISDSYSLSPSQCESALNTFLQFDQIENPFNPSDSHSFKDMRQCLSELRQQLDHHMQESKSKLRLIRCCSMGCALCLITAVVGVVVSAVVISTHALVALVAGPICPFMLPSSVVKREMVHLAQLDAAAMGAYVVQNDLDTIGCLVARLHSTIESDRVTIRLGLERSKDRYNIQEMLKQVRKNRPSFEQQFDDLKEHLFLCFAAINRTRLLLLREIHTRKNPI